MGIGVDFSDVVKVFQSIKHDKKLAFVSSKYKGDIDANIQKAIEYGKIAIEMGYIPIVPHLYLPLMLDDNEPEQRELAQEMCLELVKRCDVFMQCGDMPDDSFMVEELAQAVKSHKVIKRVY